jgi:hypothetical protein
VAANAYLGILVLFLLFGITKLAGTTQMGLT